MSSIGRQLAPFRKPLIILGIFGVIMLIIGVVLPKVNSAIANTTPIVSIEATNSKEYSTSDEISISDFTVIATHENGKTSTVSSDNLEMSDVSISPIGATTAVTIYLAEDNNISCEATVNIDRDPVVSFQVGYPEISNVTAVLYTNGELCFEGSGDVLVFDEGDCPWLDYDNMDDYPITAVSFEEGVAPTDMNYWFEDLETLTYVDKIPSSVKTMVRTFSGCTSLTVAADWSECDSLLNINEVYSDCESLTTTAPLVSSIRTAYQAYAGCISLTSCADGSEATSLTNCEEMYIDCSMLVEAEIPVGAENITSMFENCINLKVMPEIPNSVEDMTHAFADDVSLVTLSTIPSSVQILDGAFQNCQLIEGELTINCNAESFSRMFDEACIATWLNLIGSSQLLDAYANTNNYGNVTVNGSEPNTNIQKYTDVFAD